ncbi:hypothetical protein ACNVED_00495 [Legionella sp. D16C41]|uniref:hypothetical protein n=1 Tax=Legionella sp. D16C41 TaxID=3402688 RepID=UPI003AF873B8
MTKYTTEELQTLQNPYKELIEDNDAFAENRDTLEQLNGKEKINLATKIILNCPTNQMRGLSMQLEALRHHGETEQSFHRILSRGLEVRQRIQAMANQANPHPQNNLLDKEFGADLFNEFGRLKIEFVQQELDSIVVNLATKTQDNQIKELTQNIRAGFSDTNLGSALGEALVLRRLLTTLRGEEPQKAFTSLDFNPDLFHKYPQLVAFYLTGHEAEIAQKLALSNEKAMVNNSLERLKPTAMTETNPLSLLYVNFQVATVNLEHQNRSKQVPTEIPSNTSNGTTQREATEIKSEAVNSNPMPKISSNRHGKFSNIKHKLKDLIHKNNEHGENQGNESKCKPCNIM